MQDWKTDFYVKDNRRLVLGNLLLICGILVLGNDKYYWGTNVVVCANSVVS